MWLLVYIPAIAGIWRYRFWGFWKWVVAMFLWQSVADFLFAASGTLDQPQGDGLITGMVRRATNDGAEVGLLGVGFWIVFLIGVVLIVSQMRPEMRRGVTFRYSYMLIGQDAPVEIDVSEAVCAATVGDRSDGTQQ